MTNGEKYKTAQKRAEAFREWCKEKDDKWCQDKWCDTCSLYWLDLEAEEEKPLPCPFCGENDVVAMCDVADQWFCTCEMCDYRTDKKNTKQIAIAAHNRVAKAVWESESTSDEKGDK